MSADNTDCTRWQTMTAPVTWCAHTCCARLLHRHDGDPERETLTLGRGELVLVQGDRAPAAPGWTWCCANGNSGLLPTSYLQPVGSKSFRARVLYDFRGGDKRELSCYAGNVLQLLPNMDDPSGWCSGIINRQQGLVPQAYVQPVEERSGPSQRGQQSPHRQQQSPRREP